MKKLISSILLVTAIATMFAGCKKEMIECCDCNSECVRKEKYDAPDTLYGEDSYWCKDCYEFYKELADEMND